MRDLLDALGHDVTDQTRQGTSSSGIEAGEVDLLVKIDKLEGLPYYYQKVFRLLCE